MKFRLERDVLADAVAWAARTLPSRPSMPMLAGLLVDAGADGLTLSSFDYEVSGRVAVAADVDEPGRVLVSGRLLADIARALPAAPVTVTSEGSRVEVRCGRSSFTLPTLPVDDYPTLPDMPGSTGTIPGATFAAAVAQVAIAAGRDDTLPTLTGIRVEIDGSTITLAATDRYRLAVREFAWNPENSALETNALVPARTLADTAKTLVPLRRRAPRTLRVGCGRRPHGLRGRRPAYDDPPARRRVPQVPRAAAQRVAPPSRRSRPRPSSTP